MAFPPVSLRAAAGAAAWWDAGAWLAVDLGCVVWLAGGGAWATSTAGASKDNAVTRENGFDMSKLLPGCGAESFSEYDSCAGGKQAGCHVVLRVKSAVSSVVLQALRARRTA